jgi:hypothetical protein
MPGNSQHPKESGFNFRIDPALRTAFNQATEAENKPAAQALRDFMRAYVKQREPRAFQAEARRQSLESAKHRRNPRSDDAVSLQEFASLLEEDLLADGWKA